MQFTATIQVNAARLVTRRQSAKARANLPQRTDIV